jgi:hypothetical protein
MDQISVFIESMCSIRDHDLRLIKRKQVESYKDLPQMVLGPSGSDSFLFGALLFDPYQIATSFPFGSLWNIELPPDLKLAAVAKVSSMNWK